MSKAPIAGAINCGAAPVTASTPMTVTGTGTGVAFNVSSDAPTNAGKLSDGDTEALIAYLRTQSAAGKQTVNPPDTLNLLGAIMLGAGMLPRGKPVFTSVITAPPKGPTEQYGEYIMSYQDCRESHGCYKFLQGPLLHEVKVGSYWPKLTLHAPC